MGLKFNCSNLECRQRLEVDDSLAGQTIVCPACATECHVPVSHDIRFTCRTADCGQHIVVDVSEAGRFVKCPACGKPQRVPGSPPKPIISPLANKPVAAASSAVALIEESKHAPLRQLCWGWGVGTVLVSVLLLGFHLRNSAAVPSNLEAIADEIHFRFYPDTNRPPVVTAQSKEVARVEMDLTNAQGKVVNYYFVPPANLEVGKKYPVVVDQSSSIKNKRMRDIQFLANAGIYYLSPNEYGITKWLVSPDPSDVLAVVAEFGKLSTVDTKRLYVMGQSGTTGAAVQLVNMHPELWRGLLLMEPSAYPMLPERANKFPSIFISLGDNDRHNLGPLGQPGRAEKFLATASASLIPARIEYQSGDHGHPPEELKRAYIAAVKFILTDY